MYQAIYAVDGEETLLYCGDESECDYAIEEHIAANEKNAPEGASWFILNVDTGEIF